MLKSSAKAKIMEQTRGGTILPEGPGVPLGHRAEELRSDLGWGAAQARTQLPPSLHWVQDLQQKGAGGRKHFLMHVFCFQGSLSAKYF